MVVGSAGGTPSGFPACWGGGRKRSVYALQNPEPFLAPKELDLLSLEPSQLHGVGEVEGCWQASGRPGRPGRQTQLLQCSVGPGAGPAARAGRLQAVGGRQEEHWPLQRSRPWAPGPCMSPMRTTVLPGWPRPQGGLQPLLLFGEEAKPLLLVLLAETGIRGSEGR